ncbi:LacI family DNA-binding transcriptional regulator [Nostocoides sp. HKS02]|uniref:LacI family DNA-binding transcriptional regulator n=1 Tax=Nostocoides sp. HKS02 TaxID=1813880 RepID=UPI0012B4D894|nr:LacI family DNA-binding transcriptional regulator [Tetrasphaera sp. HKS02]QGN57435.1 substrate-binding domain-containing protein [Tetrasphaera sp. HKS02]
MASVSIKDVAARAGVSLGTVSNVLNRPAAVRPATRARVEAAIAELGFVPNGSARQLAAGRSRTIAYLVLDTANPFFNDVARGIEEVARTSGLSLFLCNSDQDAEREDEYLEQLAQLRVRGVLITAMDYSNPRLKGLRDQGVPVVLVDRAPDTPEDWCTVGVDDVTGGSLAISHLVEGGHRRLALVGGPGNIPQVADRHTGAVNAMVDAGLDPQDLVWIQTDALTIADGRRAGERLLGLPKRRRPSGVFCANDLLALGLLQHLIQHGVRVPEDVAIVGYDDIEYAAGAAVPLTSVAQPRLLLGRTAARLLAEESEAGTDHQHQHVVFPPELVARASTAVTRTGP